MQDSGELHNSWLLPHLTHWHHHGTSTRHLGWFYRQLRILSGGVSPNNTEGSRYGIKDGIQARGHGGDRMLRSTCLASLLASQHVAPSPRKPFRFLSATPSPGQANDLNLGQNSDLKTSQLDLWC